MDSDFEFTFTAEELETWAETMHALAQKKESEGDREGAKMYWTAGCLFLEEAERLITKAPVKEYIQ